MACGSQFTKIDKAFAELAEIGLVDVAPWRMFGAQSSRLRADRDGVRRRA